MKERSLSKDEAFMMDTAAVAEVMKEQKHKAAFDESRLSFLYDRFEPLPFFLKVRSEGVLWYDRVDIPGVCGTMGLRFLYCRPDLQ